MQVRDRRRAGDQQEVRRTTEQPGQRDLHGRGTEARSDVGQGRRLQRVEAAERKERDISGAVAGQFVDHGIVTPMREVVLVLHADDLADPASFRDLRGGDVAQPDVTHQTLPLELGQHRERCLE